MARKQLTQWQMLVIEQLVERAVQFESHKYHEGSIKSLLGTSPMIERHTCWITVFRKTNGTEERLGRHKCETPMDVRTALTLSAAHVFDFPHENGPVLKGDFVETIVAQGDTDGSMFGVVGIRPCRDGEWDIGEHEGCGKDTERAVRRYA